MFSWKFGGMHEPNHCNPVKDHNEKIPIRKVTSG